MFLKRINLKNYRRYRNEDIEFPTGLIGIVGKNGSGKSSLIEAVGWCLYGNKTRTNNDLIKTTGIPDAENCSVTLEMILGSDTVKIIRELRGKNASGHASLFLNGNSAAEVRGMNEVSEFVSKRTGMDSVAFFTSVFAKQKELNGLSNLQPSERKKIIMKLLRINKIDEVIAAIRSDVKKSNQKISWLQNDLKDINSIEKESIVISEKKEETSKRIKVCDSEIKLLRTKIVEKKTEFERDEKKYRDHSRTSSELGKTIEQKKSKMDEKKIIESDLKHANSSKKKRDEIAPRLKDHQTVKKEKEGLVSAYGKFKEKKALERQYKEIAPKIRKQDAGNKKIEEKFFKLKGIDHKLRECNKELKKHTAQKDNINKSINTISSKMNSNDTQKLELEEKIHLIKKQGNDGECPTCKRPLKDHRHDVVKDFEQEIYKISDSNKINSEKKKKMESELKSVNEEIKKLEVGIKCLEDMKINRTNLQTRLKEGEKAMRVLNQDKSHLRKKLEKFSGLKYNHKHHLAINKRHKELSKIKDESMRLYADIKRIPVLSDRRMKASSVISKMKKDEVIKRKKLDSIGYNESEYEKSKKGLEQTKDEHGKVRENRIKLKGELEKLKLEMGQITRQIKEEKEKQITIDEEKEKIELRSSLEKIMHDFRIDLMSRIRPMLSQRSSELFRKITKGRYPSMSLDSDYNIRIKDEGGSFTAKRFSGGEEDLANLCLRIAISHELAERTGGMQSNFIALDEIFGSQDEGRKSDILEALSELSNQFKQILIITHVEDVKERLPYVLNIKENSENMAEIEIEGMPQLQG